MPKDFFHSPAMENIQEWGRGKPFFPGAKTALHHEGQSIYFDQ